MTTIARLPEPPYFAVIAPAELEAEVRGYPAMAARTLEHASTIDGFHGIEMCGQPGFSLAVSYWASLDAIDTWRHHPRHQQAKAMGQSTWFRGYATRIAQVIDAY